jgi:hypothetical protein
MMECALLENGVFFRIRLTSAGAVSVEDEVFDGRVAAWRHAAGIAARLREEGWIDV